MKDGVIKSGKRITAILEHFVAKVGQAVSRSLHEITHNDNNKKSESV